MPSSPLSWVFRLIDKVSAPAGSMSKAMGVVQAGLKGAAGALGHATKAILHFGHESKEAAGHHEGFIHRLHDGLHVLESLHRGFEWVGEKASEFLSEMAFKRNSLIGMEAMTGSLEKAKQLFEQTEALAGKTGMAVNQLMAMTKDLLSGGFNAKEINTLEQAIGDLGVVRGAGDMQTFADVIADIGRKGSMSTRHILALNHAGISSEAVFKRLAATYGSTVEEMKKLAEEGKVGAKVGVKALVDQVRMRYSGGTVGSLLKRQADTLPGAVARVKMIPELLKSAITGLDRTGFETSLTKVLTNVADAFDPSSAAGERIVERIRGLMGAVAKAFGFGGGDLFKDLAGPGGVAKVEALFKGMADSVERSLPALRAMADILGGLVKTVGFLAQQFHAAGQALGSFAGAAAYGGAGVPGLPGNASAEAIRMAEEQLRRGGGSLLANQKAREVLGLPPANLQAPAGGAGSPQVTINVDARGATKDDADHISSKIGDHVTALFEQMAVEQGAR